MGLILTGYHLPLPKSPFSLCRSSLPASEFVRSQQQADSVEGKPAKACRPYSWLRRICVVQGCLLQKANVLTIFCSGAWQSRPQAQVIFRQCYQSIAVWFLLPQLKIVSQEKNLRGMEARQLLGRRWQKESRIVLTQKEGMENYIAKGRNV